MGLKEDQVPVIFEISFRSKKGLFELADEYTAFPGEDEVLLQDGLKYRVIDNSDEETENTKKKFQLIKLVYPANS